MFQGKMKAVTFSYDDGVTQDKRFIDMLNKYNLKGTFNLNSELLGKKGELIREGVRVDHTKILPDEVASVYCGHEVAAHTLTHPMLTKCSDEEIVRQVEIDRKKLSDLVGYEVVGMAYPGGGVNYNEHVASVIKERTGVKYARTTVSTYNFQPQTALYTFHPSVYHVMEMEQLFRLGEAFVSMKADVPQVFYIWGHSYEFDIHNTWDKIEKFCAMIANRDDIFYGTNKEVLLCDGGNTNCFESNRTHDAH